MLGLFKALLIFFRDPKTNMLLTVGDYQFKSNPYHPGVPEPGEIIYPIVRQMLNMFQGTIPAGECR